MMANGWRAGRCVAAAVVWLTCATAYAQYLPEYPTGELGPRDEARMRRLYTLYPTTPPGLIPCPNPTSPYGNVMPAREGMLVTTVNRPIAAEPRFAIWRSNFPDVGGSTMNYSYITRPNRRIISRETARQAATLSGPTAYVPQVIAQPMAPGMIGPAPGSVAQPCPTFSAAPLPAPPGVLISPPQPVWTNQPLQPGIAPELVPPPPLEAPPREF